MMVSKVRPDTFDSSHGKKDQQSREGNFKQLRIFIPLLKHIEQQFEKAMEGISSFFKAENVGFFRRGERKVSIKVEEKGLRKVEKFITHQIA